MAEAVHHKLHNGYLIKKHGTWGRVITHRSDWLLKGGVHYQKLHKGKVDDITYLIVDMRGSFSSAIRNHTDELMKMMEAGGKSTLSSLVENDGEGEERFAEAMDSPVKYSNAVKKMVYSKHDFVKQELADVIVDLIPSADSRGLRQSLEFLSDNYMDNKKTIDSLVEVSVVDLVEYLKRANIRGDDIMRKLDTVMDMLRGKVTTPKGQTKDMYDVKDDVLKLVKEATGKKTYAWLQAIVNAIVLYVFLRGVVGRNI
jgi:hypothetical protein